MMSGGGVCELMSVCSGVWGARGGGVEYEWEEWLEIEICEVCVECKRVLEESGWDDVWWSGVFGEFCGLMGW